MTQTSVDAVLLDVGGVIVLPDATVIGPLLAPFGGSSSLEVHRRAHYAAMAAKAYRHDPEGRWEAYDEAYVERVGVRHADRDLALATISGCRSPYLWRQPIRDSVAAMWALQRRGVPLGIVSNAAGQVARVLEWLGICQVGTGEGVEVRVVVDSHIVGVEKPNPLIFEHALADFGECDRSRIAYVGDSASIDVVGASDAGLRPVLLDPFGDHADADVECIGSLVDLLDLLGAAAPG